MSELVEFDASLMLSDYEPTPEEIEEYIYEFEKVCREAEQIYPEMQNYFGVDVYAREMKMPKGSVFTGHFHKFENLNILSKGKCIVISPNGKQKIEAPFTQVFKPGKKMFFVEEDMVWTTIIGTELKNEDEIKEKFINPEIDI